MRYLNGKMCNLSSGGFGGWISTDRALVVVKMCGRKVASDCIELSIICVIRSSVLGIFVVFVWV